MGTKVTLASGQIVDMSWREEDPERLQDALRNVYGRLPRPKCGCVDGKRELEVINNKRSPRIDGAKDRFHLSCQKSEGPLHSRDCYFHERHVEESGLAGYVEGVVRRDDSGLHVRLAFGLNRNAKPPKIEDRPKDNVAPKRRGYRTQRAMTELGLLSLLWEEARLNEWHPGFASKRNWASVSSLLDHAADEISCGRVDLQDVMFVIKNGCSPKSVNRWYAKVRELHSGKCLILIGEVSRLDKAGIVLLGGKEHGLQLTGDSSVIGDLLKSVRKDVIDCENSASTCKWIGIFVVEAEVHWNRVTARVIRGGLMEVSNNFMPFASSYELKVTEELTNRGCRFIKPLRYESSDLVFPDFLLQTGDGWIPMEVFGMLDEKYERRKKEKQDYYNQVYGVDKWWCWIAAGPDKTAMPDIPS